jgi:hypothetical protein
VKVTPLTGVLLAVGGTGVEVVEFELLPVASGDGLVAEPLHAVKKAARTIQMRAWLRARIFLSVSVGRQLTRTPPAGGSSALISCDKRALSSNSARNAPAHASALLEQDLGK